MEWVAWDLTCAARDGCSTFPFSPGVLLDSLVGWVITIALCTPAISSFSYCLAILNSPFCPSSFWDSELWDLLILSSPGSRTHMPSLKEGGCQFSFHLTFNCKQAVAAVMVAFHQVTPSLGWSPSVRLCMWLDLGCIWKPVVWFKFHLTPTLHLQQELLKSKWPPAPIHRRLPSSPSGPVPSMALSAAEEACYWEGAWEPPAEWPCALDSCQGNLMLAQLGHFPDAMATSWHSGQGGEGQHGLPRQPRRPRMSATRSPKPATETETRWGHRL